MPIANYTTSIAVSKSLTEIQTMLANAGAQAIMVEYANKLPEAVTFRIMSEGQQLGFRLPADWRKTLQLLNKEPKVPSRLRNNEHAQRVTWRVIKDWLRAQLALVEIGNVTMPQVMLSYLVTNNGETMYERVMASGTLRPQLLEYRGTV